MVFDEASFWEHRSLGKKVSYHWFCNSLKFAVEICFRSIRLRVKEFFVRSLKAVSEFDSFVSLKDWKVLTFDSILSQLKSKVVGNGPEHLFD